MIPALVLIAVVVGWLLRKLVVRIAINIGAGRPKVTTWHRTVFEARQSRANELGVQVHEVMGRRVA